MKLCIKRIHCANCRRLVTGREEQVGDGTTLVLCSRCRKPLYVWNGIAWRPAPQGG